jgi:hypothetical protein
LRCGALVLICDKDEAAGVTGLATYTSVLVLRVQRAVN